MKAEHSGHCPSVNPYCRQGTTEWNVIRGEPSREQTLLMMLNIINRRDRVSAFAASQSQHKRNRDFDGTIASRKAKISLSAAQ
jgi:hypothetical protein